MTAYDTLHISGLPLGITDENLRQVFGQYVPVLASKLGQAGPGESTVAALLGVAKDASQWLLSNLHGKVPTGLQGPVAIQMYQDQNFLQNLQASQVNAQASQQAAQQAQAQAAYAQQQQPQQQQAYMQQAQGQGMSQAGAQQQAYGQVQAYSSGGAPPSQHQQQEEKTNLYVKGLPGTMNDDMLKQIFSQYGNVKSTRVLPQTAGKPDATGFVRFMTQQEAQNVIDTCNGTILQGLDKPLIIRYAGEKAPREEKQGGNSAIQGQEEGDWVCEQCQNHNFRRRSTCNRCGAA